MILNILRGETTLDVRKRRSWARDMAASSSKPFKAQRVYSRMPSVASKPEVPPSGLLDNSDSSPIEHPDATSHKASHEVAPPQTVSSPKNRPREFGMVYIPRRWVELHSDHTSSSGIQIGSGDANSVTLTRASSSHDVSGWVVLALPQERMYDLGWRRNWRVFWRGTLEESWEMSPTLLRRMKDEVKRYETGNT
ncbi:uncharacterized protein EI90DRAFT_3068164 [Cantharellus anzutake]|uniref:uncharacterized protein n=1 Tax=Cantharellus anzutake TaxID=1750568 RepID=UPI001906F5D3|nr:uncharacterized protein EI90DRAFT_3068164 [Cantharellus anzutake]KAF8327170.1 hypothetical protein EI90DRAFT_3068164 [Cantharellus anzutake]